MSLQISASMCHTLPSPCSSAQSRKKETQPLRTVSITLPHVKYFLNESPDRNEKSKVSPQWLDTSSIFPPIRDDCGGSGHCCWYSHPGADSRYGERSLPPRTRRHRGRPEQLLKVCWAERLRACHFPGTHGEQTFTIILSLVFDKRSITTLLVEEQELLQMVFANGRPFPLLFLPYRKRPTWFLLASSAQSMSSVLLFFSSVWESKKVKH